MDSWAYWLQNIRLVELEGAPFDLVVIDYSRDGSSRGAFSASEIKALREEGKTVLAYLSIGEAEEYRFYWDKHWRVDPGSPAIRPSPPTCFLKSDGTFSFCRFYNNKRTVFIAVEDRAPRD